MHTHTCTIHAAAAPGPPASPNLNPRLAELATEVKDLNTRFATTCVQARQHYSSLSKAMASAVHDKMSLQSFSFSLSSPSQERKGLEEGMRGSESFDGVFHNHDEGHRHSKRHKKSKGHKQKRKDRLSLSLEPEDESKHPLARSRFHSVNQPAHLSASSPNSPLHSKQDFVETSKTTPRGLTQAQVTDLDGFSWGGANGVASVDSTLPSSAKAFSTSAGTSSTVATRISGSRKTVATPDDSGGIAVLRRRISLPEELNRRRSSGSLQFVQELGLLQIKEEGTRGLRPRSAVLLSDSEQDLSSAVQAAMTSAVSGQRVLLSKAMKTRNAGFAGERAKSNSSMTLHALSETDNVESSKSSSFATGKGQQFHLQYAVCRI